MDRRRKLITQLKEIAPVEAQESLLASLERLFDLLDAQYDPEMTITRMIIGKTIALAYYRGAPLTVSDIARATRRSRSTVQAAVAQGVKEGWWYLEPDQEDSRRRLVMLSDSELKYFRKFFERFFRLVQEERQSSAATWADLGLITLDQRDTLQEFLDEVSPVVLRALRRARQ